MSEQDLSWREWNLRLRAEAALLGIESYSAIALINWWAMRVTPRTAARMLEIQQLTKEKSHG